MPRLPRSCPAGLPQHVIQRGNNRQPCFASADDFRVYLACLDRASRQYCVDIHAWVLMTNHVHLLASPCNSGGISAMMQSLGRDYVTYFNQRYQRSGTLWEGRFRSCVIESEQYLLCCYRYIELNPVRAGMVAAPGDYVWSSYRSNAWGKRSQLIVPHEQYLLLGKTAAERMAAYRELFRLVLDDGQLNEIRKTLNTGMALGSERFKDEIGSRWGRRVRPGLKGRPDHGKANLNNLNGL